LNGLRLVDISNNLGDAKSLATHPRTTTHRRVSLEEQALIGLRPGHVRLSVGLESVDDLEIDILAALNAV
jgi:O-succinylhomoserine sulfhydrylase